MIGRRFGGSRDLLESRLSKRGDRSHVGVEARARLDGIALDDLGALGEGVGDRRMQQAKRQPCPRS